MLLNDFQMDANEANHLNNLPIHIAAQSSIDALAKVELLASKELTCICKQGFQGKTPLQLAAEYGNPDVVNFFLARGVYLDCDERRALFHLAVDKYCNTNSKEKSSSYLEIIVNLVKYGEGAKSKESREKYILELEKWHKKVLDRFSKLLEQLDNHTLQTTEETNSQRNFQGILCSLIVRYST